MFSGVLNKILWGILGTFAVGTILILVSWNSVPGDFTYGIKIGMEQLSLSLIVSPDLKSTLQIKYAERRFSEVEKVLPTDQAGESLDNFNRQIIAAKDTIKDIKDPEQKSIQAQNLIDKLKAVSQKIEQEKRNNLISYISPTTAPRQNNKAYVPATNNNVSPNVNTPTVVVRNQVQTISDVTNNIVSTPTFAPRVEPTKIIPPTSTPTIAIAIIATAKPSLIPTATTHPTNTPTPKPSPTSVPTPTNIPTPTPVPQSSAEIVVQLDETQKNIDQVIEELKDEQNQPSIDSPSTQQANDKKDRPNGDRNNDKGDRNDKGNKHNSDPKPKPKQD